MLLLNLCNDVCDCSVYKLLLVFWRLLYFIYYFIVRWLNGRLFWVLYFARVDQERNSNSVSELLLEFHQTCEEVQSLNTLFGCISSVTEELLQNNSSALNELSVCFSCFLSILSRSIIYVERVNQLFFLLEFDNVCVVKSLSHLIFQLLQSWFALNLCRIWNPLWVRTRCCWDQLLMITES